MGCLGNEGRLMVDRGMDDFPTGRSGTSEEYRRNRESG